MISEEDLFKRKFIGSLSQNQDLEILVDKCSVDLSNLIPFSKICSVIGFDFPSTLKLFEEIENDTCLRSLCDRCEKELFTNLTSLTEKDEENDFEEQSNIEIVNKIFIRLRN